MEQARLLAVVGPTASGKSELALRLAQRFDGEIVSADSRQVYRYMDIGTAKPSKADRELVPHHLIDVVTPDAAYSLARFLRDAKLAIRETHERGRLPILAGGTAQYVWALLEGWQTPEAAPDPAFRAALEARAQAEGPQALHDELRSLDARRAAEIQPANVRRVIRALEVRRALGERAGPRKLAPPYGTLILGLATERADLYARIDARVDRMIADGWPGEVRRLTERGYGPELSSMSGVGYRELGLHLRGELSLEEAAQRTKYRTHRFARSQRSWFRRDDARIRWFPSAPHGFDAAERATRAWLAAHG